MPPFSETPLSVVVVAGDELGRRRLKDALGLDGIVVQREIASHDDLTTDDAPDVVVVSCDDSATRRRKLIRELRGRLPNSRVVVVCSEESVTGARKTLEAGADGFVLEPQLETTLALTVLVVHAGQLAVPRPLRHQVNRPSLSYREKQILGLLVMGFTNAEIGHQLFLAESTVKSHLTSVFEKLGVRSRNDAVALVLDPEERLGPGILAISEGEGEPLLYDLAEPSQGNGTAPA
jgi:DNA-binding NarL/FixJ family response regulator